MEPERVANAAYVKALFAHKLQEAGVQNEFCRRVYRYTRRDIIRGDVIKVPIITSG